MWRSMKSVLFLLLLSVSLSDAILDSNDADTLTTLANYWPAMQIGPNPWDVSNVSNACEAWRGLLCESFDGNLTERVTVLDLHNEPLNKAIPANVTNLSALLELNLANTSGVGSLPDTWDSLQNLSILVLSHNLFAGSIPPTFGQLEKLEVLELDSNRLKGQVPSALKQLTNLKVLNVTQNSLSGLLTSWFGSWPQLEVFSASFNPLWTWQAVYSMTPEIGLCKHLRVLEFGGNAVQLPFPPDVGELLELEVLNFKFAQLTAWPNVTHLPNLREFIGGFDLFASNYSVSLPEEIAGMNSLESFELQYGVTGSIPDSISVLTNLRRLSLSGLRISGTLPASIGALASLEYLDISGNYDLTGPIPDQLNLLTNLKVFRADRCSFNALPSSMDALHQLEQLSITNNQLTALPEGLGALTSLRVLSLQNNQISGTLSPEIGWLSNLEQLSLGNNRFTSLIDFSNLTNLWRLEINNVTLPTDFPTSIAVLSNLTHLSLASNHLEGTMPDSFFASLPKLRSLLLAYNNISGLIPSSLAALTELRFLDLSVNALSGPLPDLSHMPLLQLSLEHNEIEGSVPDWIAQMTETISVINLHHNRLNGTLPESLGNTLHPYMQIDLSYNQLEGGLPMSMNGSAGVRAIWLGHNRMHFCPSSLTYLNPNLFCDLQYQDYPAYDCGCTTNVYAQCTTSPPVLHECVPCASPAPSNTLPWECREGYWFYDAREQELPEMTSSDILLFESSALVLGHLNVPRFTANGLRAQLNISRCADIRHMTLHFSKEDLETIRANGGQLPRPLVVSQFEFLFNASQCQYPPSTVVIDQPPDKCATLSSNGVFTSGAFSGSFTIASAASCVKKNVPWWAIVLAVFLAIGVIAVTLALLATYVPAVRKIFRPFHKKQAALVVSA